MKIRYIALGERILVIFWKPVLHLALIYRLIIAFNSKLCCFYIFYTNICISAHKSQDGHKKNSIVNCKDTKKWGASRVKHPVPMPVNVIDGCASYRVTQRKTQQCVNSSHE